jgi:hypothetical protein
MNLGWLKNAYFFSRSSTISSLMGLFYFAKKCNEFGRE